MRAAIWMTNTRTSLPHQVEWPIVSSSFYVGAKTEENSVRMPDSLLPEYQRWTVTGASKTCRIVNRRVKFPDSNRFPRVPLRQRAIKKNPNNGLPLTYRSTCAPSQILLTGSFEKVFGNRFPSTLIVLNGHPPLFHYEIKIFVLHLNDNYRFVKKLFLFF